MKNKFLIGVMAFLMCVSVVPKVSAEGTLSKASFGHTGMNFTTIIEHFTDTAEVFNYFYNTLNYDPYAVENEDREAVVNMVSNNITGDFNLENYLTSDELSKLHETIYKIQAITNANTESYVGGDMHRGYNYANSNILNNLDLFCMSADFYDYFNAESQASEYYVHDINFSLNDAGVEYLEKMLYNFDYNQYINNMNGKTTYSRYAIDAINISNTGIHSMQGAQYGYGGATIHSSAFDLTGYTVGDILYVNFNALYSKMGAWIYPSLIQYNSYMMFLMTGDEDYPFQLIKSDWGSNDRVDIIAYVEEIFSPNITFDASYYSTFTEMSQYTDYLTYQLGLLNGTEPNEKGYIELENYILAIISQLGEVKAEVSGNNINIQDENYSSVLSQSTEFSQVLDGIYSNYSMDINNFSNEAQNKIILLDQGLSNIVTSSGQEIVLENVESYNVLEMPSVEIDYSHVASLRTSEQLYTYLEDLLKNAPYVNERAMLEVEEYINYVTTYTQTYNLDTENNKISLDADVLSENIQETSDFYSDIIKLAKDYGVNFSKDTSTQYNIYVSDVDLDEPIRIELTENWKNFDIEKINIIIKKAGHMVSVEVLDLLNSLDSNDTLIFDITFVDNYIHLFFVENEDDERAKIDGKITISAPVSAINSSIFATIEEVTQNWGGQVSGNNIEFQTGFTGIYEILDNSVEILDISQFDDETIAKINFMVSKGFFSVDETGNFRPDGEVQRYHFITALVRMFFSQDNNATSNFSDLPADNFYYTLVSAATEQGIVNGYDDGTFKGDKIITRVEIVSFIARTLAEQKGYLYSENSQNIIKIYSDNENIAEWAVDDIALALEYGLINYSGNFEPNKEVSRLEAIELLYMLFMSLYEVPQMVNYDITDVNETFDIGASLSIFEDVDNIVIYSIAGILALFLVGAGIFVAKRKKNTPVLNETVPQTVVPQEIVPQETIVQTTENNTTENNTTENNTTENIQPQASQNDMCFCTKCGNKMPITSTFCGKCGSKKI